MRQKKIRKNRKEHSNQNSLIPVPRPALLDLEERERQKQEEDTKIYFEDLPNEVITIIVNYLPTSYLKIFKAVSIRMWEVVKADPLLNTRARFNLPEKLSDEKIKNYLKLARKKSPLLTKEINILKKHSQSYFLEKHLKIPRNICFLLSGICFLSAIIVFPEENERVFSILVGLGGTTFFIACLASLTKKYMFKNMIHWGQRHHNITDKIKPIKRKQYLLVNGNEIPDNNKTTQEAIENQLQH